MKRLMAFGLVLLASLYTAWPQGKEKTLAELKAEIAALQLQLNNQQTNSPFASKFAGFGRELGVTMNSFIETLDGGMKVTTTRVNEFAKTDVGRFSMIAIGWKIFADDVLSLGQSAFNKTAGFIFLIAFCWLLKRTIEILCWGRMIVIKKEGPWYARSVTKERTIPVIKTQSVNSDAEIFFIVISIIGMIVLFIAACIGLTH